LLAAIRAGSQLRKVEQEEAKPAPVLAYFKGSGQHLMF
jgi:hypothetical protein